MALFQKRAARIVLAAAFILGSLIGLAHYLELNERSEAYAEALSRASGEHEARLLDLIASVNVLAARSDELWEESVQAQEALKRLNARSESHPIYRENRALSARLDEVIDARNEALGRTAAGQLDCRRMNVWPEDAHTRSAFVDMTGYGLFQRYKSYLAYEPRRLTLAGAQYRQFALCLALIIHIDSRDRMELLRERSPLREIRAHAEAALKAQAAVKAVDELLSTGRDEAERQHAASAEAYEKLHRECLEELPSRRHATYCSPAPPLSPLPPPPASLLLEAHEKRKAAEARVSRARDGGSAEMKSEKPAKAKPENIPALANSAGDEKKLARDPAEPHEERTPRTIKDVPPPKPVTLYSEREEHRADLSFSPERDVKITLSARAPAMTDDGRLKLIAQREGESPAILASFECVTSGCELIVAPRVDGLLVAQFSSHPSGRHDGAIRSLLFEWDDERGGLFAIESVRETWISDPESVPTWAYFGEE